VRDPKCIYLGRKYNIEMGLGVDGRIGLSNEMDLCEMECDDEG
jgi:hypothetical protein